MFPLVRIGAASPFGLALPAAEPTASQLYAPRGVWLDNERLVVADSGNHRVLIWHDVPQQDGAPANVVLGQQTFSSEGPRSAGTSSRNGMHLPTGVIVHQGALLVADAWHHRVLVWDRIPTDNNTPPTRAIGQPDLESITPNRGGTISGTGLYWPYGLAVVDGWLWIADTGNRRVLGWRNIPLADEPADVVLGQDTFTSGDENRGGAVTASSFRWPHAIAGNADSLYVADAGNHRVLIWDGVPRHDTPATRVLGQPDFTSNTELPHRKQGAHRMRFPYAIGMEGDTLTVADTANNRVLVWPEVSRAASASGASAVMGQHNFDDAGENRWKAVANDTLCWPYGLSLFGDRLAIADSGNNRVMLWSMANTMADAAPAGAADAVTR